MFSCRASIQYRGGLFRVHLKMPLNRCNLADDLHQGVAMADLDQLAGVDNQIIAFLQLSSFKRFHRLRRVYRHAKEKGVGVGRCCCAAVGLGIHDLHLCAAKRIKKARTVQVSRPEGEPASLAAPCTVSPKLNGRPECRHKNTANPLQTTVTPSSHGLLNPATFISSRDQDSRNCGWVARGLSPCGCNHA